MIAFIAILVVGMCAASYYIGYHAGARTSAKHYAKLFAKGVQTWMLKDFAKNGIDAE